MYYFLMTSNSFLKWITNVMIERELSAAELARKAQVSEGTLSRILNGERNPGVEVLIKLADGLRIPRIEVFEAAGLLGDQVPKSKDVTRLAHRINMLPDNQREVVITLINAILSQGVHQNEKEVEAT